MRAECGIALNFVSRVLTPRFRTVMQPAVSRLHTKAVPLSSGLAGKLCCRLRQSKTFPAFFTMGFDCWGGGESGFRHDAICYPATGGMWPVYRISRTGSPDSCLPTGRPTIFVAGNVSRGRTLERRRDLGVTGFRFFVERGPLRFEML